jgi:murein DD-endopeptidase MepM/ murein hydrolase activator NlpD
VDQVTRLFEAAARSARRNGLDRLVPVAICALLVVAAVVSAVPQATPASAAAGPTAAAATAAAAPAAVVGKGDGPAAQDFSDLYLGDGSIPNTLQNPATGTDATALLRTYTVRSGDTLGKIAGRYQLATATVYWANKFQLANPSSIHAGQKLLIPPMDGLLVKVTAKMTLASLAKKYGLQPQDIIDTNNLPDPNLTVGETIIIPGATGGSLPAAPKTKAQLAYRAPGGWVWPVAGKNFISQYFWAGHHAIDIAAKKGTPVVAAITGTVVFVGDRGYNGGGNVVWLEEGPRLYTTYNHLTTWTVHLGQRVLTGHEVGTVGMTGAATGPHLHFEVWLSKPYANGTNSLAVNPCIYLAGC